MIKSRIIKWSLFNELYPEHQIQAREMNGEYVGDSIDDCEIGKWHEGLHNIPNDFHRPIFISAQTGKGKNYFITHTLREFALKANERILYVSNRIALDYQQKRDLSDLTHEKLDSAWEEQEKFSNVTVLTYHKLLTRLYNEKDEWFSSFKYVVLDECHFFYSDAYFNAYTWDILKLIPQKFANSIRIYMSATLDDVFEPIRYHEGLATQLEKNIDSRTFLYYFPRDFRQYSIYAFSKADQIINRIQSESTKDKWVIFATNKVKGKEWKELLGKKNGVSVATYIDSESKRSEDTMERVAWEELKKNGRFDSKVLITTSVIDNGFSLKDERIKNIVLFTHDHTEFLQELGRCRLEKGKNLNVFYKKLSAQEQEFRRRQYKRFQDVIFQFYGDEDTKNGSDFIDETNKGDPISVIKSLWNVNEDLCRGFISLGDAGNGTLIPHINLMARWRTKRLGEQIEEYDNLALQYPDTVDKLYKARWFIGDKESVEDCNLSDLDEDEVDNVKKELESLLKNAASNQTIFDESSKEFEKFSRDFEALYRKIYPKDPATNRGKERSSWKHKAINSRLDKIRNDKNWGISFQFQSVGSGWKMVECESSDNR